MAQSAASAQALGPQTQAAASAIASAAAQGETSGPFGRNHAYWLPAERAATPLYVCILPILRRPVLAHAMAAGGATAQAAAQALASSFTASPAQSRATAAALACAFVLQPTLATTLTQVVVVVRHHLAMGLWEGKLAGICTQSELPCWVGAGIIKGHARHL